MENLNSFAAFAEQGAEQISAVDQENSLSVSLAQRCAFMQLPLEKRRQLLAHQAEALLAHYQQDSEIQELQVGDIFDY